MNKYIKSIVCALALILNTNINAEERYILTLKPGVHAKDLTIQKSKQLGKSNNWLIKGSIKHIENDHRILYIEKDIKEAPSFISNDPYYINNYQYYINSTATNQAWDLSIGNNVKIGIADSGLDSNHQDIKSIPGYNVYLNNYDTTPLTSHGTMVSGVAAATLNNALGVAGVAGGATIVPIRIAADSTGFAYRSDMAEAVYYAADNGIRIVNISYMAWLSEAVQSAAAYMKTKNGIVVSSAGNTACDVPVALPNIIIVSAIDSNNTFASWSCFGPGITIAAPGLGIFTTGLNSSYVAGSGTSFSAPIVSGVIALMLQANPLLSTSQIESIIKASGDDLGALGYDNYYGYGKINALKAVELALTTSTEPPLIDTESPIINISYPSNNSIISGKFVNISASATDNSDISSIELIIDNKSIMSSTENIIKYRWNLQKVNPGIHTIKIKATDTSNNYSINSINITYVK